MLRRSILQLASRRSVSRVPVRTTTQIPSYLSSRRAFSVSQNKGPQKLDPGSSAHEPQSRIPKILVGGFALGSVLLVAYYNGVLDSYIGKQQQSIGQYTKAGIGDKNREALPERQNFNHQSRGVSETNSSEESHVSSSGADIVKQDTGTHSKVSVPENSVRTEKDESFQATDATTAAQESVDGKDVPTVPQTSMSSVDLTGKPAQESLDLKDPGAKLDEQQHKTIDTTQTFTSAGRTPSEIEIGPVPREQTTAQDMQEVVQDGGTQKDSSLLDDYYLRDKFEDLVTSSSKNIKNTSSSNEDIHDGYISRDGKLVVDFLQAIHAAEERQAELDARSYMTEIRAIKEKYEKELKDARVRELMYAEREAILDKEIIKERVKAAAALKSLQEKLEDKLDTELEQKELEVQEKLKEMQNNAKAELTAAIASEKASQLEKMAEANLHINALCMAFYARSEEARQINSVHKLALGALALEDALSKGLPIQKEIEAVRSHVEGIDKDSLIGLVLSSLPEDTQKYGTDTLSQLSHKFDALKGTLRHFSLIPPGGGGLLSHSLSNIASWLKVKEVDESGDGIESLINRVESLLAQGKICEAADALENGVKGSQAAEVVDEWVRRARNRAITEQALTILQSYATSISLT
ncbi:hypothetical protein ACS0TY_028684 [Phlomoides rotata]